MIQALEAPYSDLKIHADSEIEQRLRVKSISKERETVAFIESIPVGSVLFDVGSNTGSYSLIAAARGLGVYAFEPSPANVAQFVRNLALNDLAVPVFPIGLGSETRLQAFSGATGEPGQALHEWGTGLPTILYRLDEFVNRFNLPHPEYLKVDVDGGELDVLMGTGDLLYYVRGLLVEVDPAVSESSRIELYLARFGLEVESRHLHERSGVSNVVYVR